jgi:hypothetical protein
VASGPVAQAHETSCDEAEVKVQVPEAKEGDRVSKR